MINSRIQHARMGALLIGTMAAFTACSPRTDNAAGDSAAVATGVGASGSAAAPAAATADSAAMPAGATLADPGIMGVINTSNAAEIGTSELAQERAASSQVKSYANDMIKAHRAMQKQGDQLAQQAKITAQPPVEADMMQKQMVAATDSMKALKGADFDAKYMAFQVQSHQQTLDKLQQFEGQAQNAELKAMITKAIPDVRAHLERAQKIQSSLGAAGTTKS